jgi:hypothetical protein
VLLRAGNGGSNTAKDHIAVTRQALAQLPSHRPGILPGRKVLIRVDGAGSTHKYLAWLAGQRLSYSVGFCLPNNTPELLALIHEHVWAPAIDAHDEVRDGAWVAELTSLLNLKGWPPGKRVIVRKERPRPGAQLRITDVDGLRVTAFATNTARGQLPDLELRHRRRARCEDRIRVAKDTGLTNLPLHGFDQNRIWCAIVALAVEITAWMQLLALTNDDDDTSAATTSRARRWEPKRLPYRLFTVPAAIARTGRRITLHLSDRAPWAHLVHAATTRLRASLHPAEHHPDQHRSATGRGTGAPPETTSGEPSHPDATISPRRRQHRRTHDQHGPDERSRLVQLPSGLPTRREAMGQDRSHACAVSADR